MEEVFQKILELSAAGSVMILAVMALRLVMKRAPGRILCLLWLLVCLRLVMPFEIESSLSLQPDMTQIAGLQQAVSQSVEPPQAPQNGETITVPQVPAVPDVGELPGDTMVGYSDNAVTEPQQTAVDGWAVAAWIWAAGAAGMLAYSLISYLRLRRSVRNAVILEEGVWVCPDLDTAFVLGFFRPRIYLPLGLTEEERRLILRHERSHIRWLDHWSKPLAFVVLALHWFNPLVWAAFVLLGRDMERACDEAVVRSMSTEERKAYSAALLSCSSGTRSIAACPVAFGEVSVKGRILNVLNYRKKSFWVILAAVIALVLVTVCLMTSPDVYDLADHGEVSVGDLSKAYLIAGDRTVKLTSPEEIRELRTLLRSVPVSQEPAKEIGWEMGDYQLILSHREVTTLHISEDCTQVWVLGYGVREVEEPETLREWLAENTDAVVDREVSGEPFAAVDEPAAWLRGVSPAAIREAEVHWASAMTREGNTTIRDFNWGNLRAREFEELIRILNDLPEDAVGEQKTLRLSGFDTLQSYMDGKEGVSVTFYDDVNGLVVILRMLEGESMELIITDELYNVEDGSRYLDHPGCWVLEDRKLLNFLREMQEHLPIVTMLKSDIRLDEKELWGLKLSAENVTPRGLTLVCEQDGTFIPGQLMTGAYFRLEKLTADGWRELPTVTDAIFTTEGWMLTKGQTHRWDVNWAWLYGELEPGDYRIFKTITLYETHGSETNWNGGVEFTITEQAQEDERLARCREALASFQAQNTYCLMIERQMSGDILNDNATQMFYVSGEDWLRHCVIDEVDFIEEDWYLNKNGRQFTKYTTHHNHDGNGVDINTGWVEGPLEENEIFQPWLRTFDLDAQPVELIGYETDGTLDRVTFRVEGAPSEASADMEVTEYTVDFVFYKDSCTIHSVVLRYTETWTMRGEGGDTQCVGHMMATMTPNAAGEDVVLQMLDACYRQACQHIDEGAHCTDPDCTDPTHDHYGISCTVEHCTDPNHGHGHHDD